MGLVVYTTRPLTLCELDIPPAIKMSASSKQLTYYRTVVSVEPGLQLVSVSSRGPSGFFTNCRVLVGDGGGGGGTQIMGFNEGL